MGAFLSLLYGLVVYAFFLATFLYAIGSPQPDLEALKARQRAAWSGDGSMVVPSEYLEVVIMRR